MDSSRRMFLGGIIGSAAAACFGQGMGGHHTAALPRGKGTGLPFNAKFTDVADQAGLKAVTIFGHADRKEYIIEALGCGCAFLDYDNDGWMDLFLLSGTVLGETPEGATNRLYKNNRDGTFTDVTEESG